MFSPVPEALEELRQGRMIVLTDDEDRENEGDLVLAAEFATPEAINFMLSVARGYLCLAMTGADCDRLDLHPQTAVNTSARATPFTVSIDGHPRHGFTTGVSAPERARAIRMAIDPTTTPEDFVRPGHINPLRARDGGVLVRTGQTEGSVDLCRMAGLRPAAVIIEVMREDGQMARLPDLEKLCAAHGLKMCSVAQIIEHRLSQESLVRRLDPQDGVSLHTPEGDFRLIAFESVVDPVPHLALTVGDVGRLDGAGRPIEREAPTLVRMHRRHLLGDIFHDMQSSPEGPTGWTLHRAMAEVQAAGQGAIVYLRPEGAGDGLVDRLQAIRRPGYQPGADTPDLTDPRAQAVPSHQRDIGVGGQILRQLGLHKLRLLTNHSKALLGLDAFGLEVVEHVPVPQGEDGSTLGDLPEQ